jgi:HD-like signal output (HDOD) protein
MAKDCPMAYSCPVKILQQICLTISELVKQAWHLPRTFMNAIRQRRGRAARNELELERLDRIRNPSKYLGK